MTKTNEQDLIEIALVGEVSHPRPMGQGPYQITGTGQPVVLPGMGGIVYNVRVGDRAFGWAADHLEPGVTIRHPKDEEAAALHIFACIGNEAQVVSGDAKGERGVVTGKHGGVAHVLVDFAPQVMAKMCIGDKVQIKAHGRGLILTDHPDIRAMNLSPRLLAAMNTRTEAGGTLTVPVAALVPAQLMGSGSGRFAEQGDYDVMTLDREFLAENGLDNLRLGDIVTLQDQDNTFGRGYRRGAISIGVVSHGDSVKAGHGPGITTLLACSTPQIVPELNKAANIARYLGL